MVTNFTNIL